MNIANYADDITPFIMKNKTNVIVSSEQVPDAQFNWFKNNRLKSNVGKCRVIIRTNPQVLKLEAAIWITVSVKNYQF